MENLYSRNYSNFKPFQDSLSFLKSLNNLEILETPKHSSLLEINVIRYIIKEGLLNASSISEFVSLIDGKIKTISDEMMVSFEFSNDSIIADLSNELYKFYQFYNWVAETYTDRALKVKVEKDGASIRNTLFRDYIDKKFVDDIIKRPNEASKKFPLVGSKYNNYKIGVPEWDEKLKELRKAIASGALDYLRKRIEGAIAAPEVFTMEFFVGALRYIQSLLKEFRLELGEDNVRRMSTLNSKDDLIVYVNSFKLDVESVERKKNEILLGLGLCSDPSQLQKLLSDIRFQIGDVATKLKNCITEMAKALEELERLSTELDVALEPSLLYHYQIDRIFNRAKRIPSELNERYKKELGEQAPTLSQNDYRGITKIFQLLNGLFPKITDAFESDSQKLSEVKPEYEKSLLDIFSNSYLFLHLLPKDSRTMAHFDKVKGQVKSLLDSQILRDFVEFRKSKPDFKNFIPSQNLHKKIIGIIPKPKKASFDFVFPTTDIQFVDHSLDLLVEESRNEYRNSLKADKKSLLTALCDSVEDLMNIKGGSLNNLRACLNNLLLIRKAMGKTEVGEKIPLDRLLLGKIEFELPILPTDDVNTLHEKFLNHEVDLLSDVLNRQINVIGNLKFEFDSQEAFDKSYNRISDICSILKLLSPFLPGRNISNELKEINNVNDRIVNLFVPIFNQNSDDFVRSKESKLPPVLLAAGLFLNSMFLKSKHFDSCEPVKKLRRIGVLNKDSLSAYLGSLSSEEFDLVESMGRLIDLLKNLHEEKNKIAIGATITLIKFNLDKPQSFKTEQVNLGDLVQVAKTLAFRKLIDNFEENFIGGLKATELKEQLGDLFQNISELKGYSEGGQFTPPVNFDSSFLVSKTSLLSFFVNSVIDVVNEILKNRRQMRTPFTLGSPESEKFMRLALAFAPLSSLEPKDFDCIDVDSLFLALANPKNISLWKREKLKSLINMGNKLQELDIDHHRLSKKGVEIINSYTNSVYAWRTPLDWVNQFVFLTKNVSFNKNVIKNLFLDEKFVKGFNQEVFDTLLELIDDKSKGELFDFCTALSRTALLGRELLDLNLFFKYVLTPSFGSSEQKLLSSLKINFGGKFIENLQKLSGIFNELATKIPNLNSLMDLATQLTNIKDVALELEGKKVFEADFGKLGKLLSVKSDIIKILPSPLKNTLSDLKNSLLVFDRLARTESMKVDSLFEEIENCSSILSIEWPKDYSSLLRKKLEGRELDLLNARMSNLQKSIKEHELEQYGDKILDLLWQFYFKIGSLTSSFKPFFKNVDSKVDQISSGDLKSVDIPEKDDLSFKTFRYIYDRIPRGDEFCRSFQCYSLFWPLKEYVYNEVKIKILDKIKKLIENNDKDYKEKSTVLISRLQSVRKNLSIESDSNVTGDPDVVLNVLCNSTQLWKSSFPRF